MDDKQRRRLQLECLYDMFRDKIEEDVIYIVYNENDAKIELTIDQLMSIAACSLTGYYFAPSSKAKTETTDGILSKSSSNTRRITTSNLSGGQPEKRDFSKTKTDSCEPANSQAEIDTECDVGDEKLDIDTRIEAVQNSITNLLTEKNNCHDKASHYLSKKMYPVTSYYSELSGNYRRMIETKTKKLIELLLLKSANANTIDLHGLNPIQAKLVVNELLNARLEQLSIDKQGKADIDIITGWGKHSVHTGQHRIRPTIVSLLREKGFEYNLINKGALRVTIRR